MADTPADAITEKLGSFYLGSTFDPESGTITGPRVHLDARDLTTHAVCVGMTGSGKTGLCIGLLEEAAIDRVPAIIIDPKGDMGNLLLHFPNLLPSDFRPWINEDDARRKGLSIDDFAKSTASLWRNGLAKWGITPDRIRALDSTVKYEVYTPGSESVRPVNVLGSLRAPVENDIEALRERVTGTVGALLGLVGVDFDPVQSRETIFLSVLFEHFWGRGHDVDLGLLVRSIQEPPVRQFGAFDVDSFFPEKDRFELAMTLNNLMVAPSFAPWLSGAPLDIDGILYHDDGTPKHSVFYIAHLSEPERMFFVTLLLNTLVSWMRQQPGTTSLRALLYFDEVFGFLPPVAEPPSKRPLLTLLKQARAFGLGSVLVTQNPVDLDYKALSNTGTWFIGRLQSKQDQQRLLQGLKTASATDKSSSSKLSDAIGRLKSRVFLLHSVHEDGPVLFHTRWVMNYLRGPLTRTQLRSAANQDDGASTPAVAPAPGPLAQSSSATHTRPSLPPGLEERFVSVSQALDVGRVSDIVFRPTIGAIATTHFSDRKYDVEARESTIHFLPPGEERSAFDWADATMSIILDDDLATEPTQASASFVGNLPSECNTKDEARNLTRLLRDWLYHNRRLSLLYNDGLDLCQKPGETETSFRSRLELAARERRDDAVDAVSERFEKQIDRLEAKLKTVSRSMAEQEEHYAARKQEELLSLGETVLGLVLGRRRRLSGVATKRRMTTSARARLEKLAARDDDLRNEIAELEDEAAQEAQNITLEWDAAVRNTTRRLVSPRRTDITVDFVGVVWLPYRRDGEDAFEYPAHDLTAINPPG